MKKIALVGLNKFNNMGDQIIAETMQYLVEKDQKNKVETYFVDISPYDSYCKKYLPARFKLFNLIRKLEPFVKKVTKSKKILYNLQYYSWKVKLYRYYKKQLKNADAVIFSGGGFIKFRTQELNYLVDMITRIANNNSIPVMMSAMGVEGYSSDDPRCKGLKNAINRSCVKVITTRDNLSLLNDKYMINKHIDTALVGDPAFYIPECYQAEKIESNVVGIGVIRSDIFLRYGIQYSEEEVMKLYQDIITELENRKIQWKLFSNGLTSDYQFGLKLLESLGIDKSKYMPRPNNSKELIDTVTSFDSIIGARLHACITAYSLDIPAVGIVWNEKLKLFGKLIAKDKNFISMDQLNAQHIVVVLEKVRNESYDIEQRGELKGLTKTYIDKFINMIE